MTGAVESIVADLRHRAAQDLHYANDLHRKILADLKEEATHRAQAATRFGIADELEAATRPVDLTPADPELAAEG